MTIFNKTFWKFAALFAVIVVLAGGMIWLDRYYQWRKSPQYQAEQYIKEMEQKYREDTYGGSTPEETLQLFIEALKKGDTDLAAKYFVLDKQDEWKGKLGKIKKQEKINLMIEDLNNLKEDQKNDNSAFFILTNSKKVVTVQLIINKNPYNNKWKIEEL